MQVPDLLNDIVRLLLALAPFAALVSLVLAGMHLRRHGVTTFAIGGGFTKWIFWSVVFITIQPLLSWFALYNISVPLPSGTVGTGWMATLQAALSNFVTTFVVGRLVPTIAAFFVLRAVLDTASGENPLASILSAMFLLATQTTYDLFVSYNTGTQFATVDVLDSIWNHIVGTIMPIAAGLALMGAILNLATRKPFARLAAASLGLLSVTAIWRLVESMMT